MALNADITLTVSSILQKLLDLSVPVDTVLSGQNGFPGCTFSFSDASGAGANTFLANAHFSDKRTLAAGITEGIDLYGALTGPLGDAFSVIDVRCIVLAIIDPDGTKKLRVGPQAGSAAAQLGFGGTGATVYKTFKYFEVIEDVGSGFAITATTADKLFVTNPGSGSVDYAIWIAGNV